MLFSTILSDSETKQISKIENKLRLNLSDHAFSVLVYDREVFCGTELSSDSIPSAFFNSIFSLFKDEAASSVWAAVCAKRRELNAVLIDVPCRESAVSRLLTHYESELVEALKGRLKDKGNAFLMRVNTDNMKYLVSDEGAAEEGYYNDSVSKYFKAVIEEYCQQPYVKRERIFFREICTEANRAKEDSRILKLTLRKTGREIKNIRYMKPLGIYQDSENMYNYLIGMILSDKTGTWEPGSIRLSNIVKADCLEKHKGVTKDERKLLEETMRRCGVQFMSGSNDSEHIVVELDEQGRRMYKSMLHLRPNFIHKERSPENPNCVRYTFDCPFFQARAYFFKFGFNARIISPQSLADQFHRMYCSAAKRYE